MRELPSSRLPVVDHLLWLLCSERFCRDVTSPLDYSMTIIPNILYHGISLIQSGAFEEAERGKS